MAEDLPDLEADPPAGAEDPSAGPGEAEFAPAESAERDERAEADDHAMRVIRHRCGDKIADMVVPQTAFEAVLEALAALSERIEEIEARTSAYGPVTDYDADACGPLQ
jgi:hypothetical protein